MGRQGWVCALTHVHCLQALNSLSSVYVLPETALGMGYTGKE